MRAVLLLIPLAVTLTAATCDDEDTPPPDDEPTPTLPASALPPLTVSVKVPVTGTPVQGITVIRGADLDEVFSTGAGGTVTLDGGAQRDPITAAWRFTQDSSSPGRDVTMVTTWVGLGDTREIDVAYVNWEDQRQNSEILDGAVQGFDTSRTTDGSCFMNISRRGSYGGYWDYLREPALYTLRASTDGDPVGYASQAPLDQLAELDCNAMPRVVGLDTNLNDGLEMTLNLAFDAQEAVRMTGVDPRMTSTYHDIYLLIPGRDSPWFSEPELPMSGDLSYIHAPSGFADAIPGGRLLSRAAVQGDEAYQLAAVESTSPQDLNVQLPPVPSYDADLDTIMAGDPQGEGVSVFLTSGASLVSITYRSYRRPPEGGRDRYVYWTVYGLGGASTLPFVQLPTDLDSGIAGSEVYAFTLVSYYGDRARHPDWALGHIDRPADDYQSAGIELGSAFQKGSFKPSRLGQPIPMP